MPELSPSDILVGRIALQQGKISRPQLDLAIAAFNRGEAANLPQALLRTGALPTPEIQAIIAIARQQEASNNLSASVVKRAASPDPLTASVFTRGANGSPPAPGAPIPGGPGYPPPGAPFAMPARPAPTPSPSPYPPPTVPAPLQQSQASFGRPAPPPSLTGSAPGRGPLAPVPGSWDGLQTVRQQAAPGPISALPPVGGTAHEFFRRQYEEFVLGRMLVARGILPDAQVQDLTRRQKLEDTASGQHTPLARFLIRSGMVSPAVIDRMSEEIKRRVFACSRCGDCFYVEPGPQPQRVACRRCQGPIEVPSVDGRTLAPAPATTMGSGDATKADAEQGDPHAAAYGAAAAPTFGSSPTGAAPPAPSTAPAGAPEKIGGWIVEREIGRGGMGVIYLARHERSGARAALKVMLNASSASEKKQRRFNREMDAVRKLDHPNIVRLLDEGEHEGYPYFAMEFVEGKPLDKLLKEELDLEQSMEILEKLCRGVDFAHEQGIIHRDIKPANILVTEELEPKLTDFGLAKSDDHKSVLTKTGAVVGTPYYLSPEQARGDSKDVDRRADIYALGVIMYELLTGRLPFVGQTTVELYNRILNDDPPPPTKVKPQLTREIEVVCLKALEKDPRDRYQSAADMADDVKALLEARPGDVKARRPSVWKRLTKRMRKKGLGVLVGFGFGIGAVVFGAGGFALWWRHAQQTRADRAHAEQDALKKTLETALATGTNGVAACDSLLPIPGRERELVKIENDAVAALEAAEGVLAKPVMEENKPWAEQLRSTRGADLKRTHALALVGRARAWMATDDPGGLDKASGDLDSALKIDPENPEAYVAQSEYYVLSNKLREALDSVTEHPQSYFPARLAKARIQRIVGDDVASALQTLDDTQQLLGSDQASCKLGLKDPWSVSRALLVCEQVLGTLASDLEEGPAKALDLARDAVQTAPGLWRTHAALARALAANGERRRARQEADKALELGKDFLAPLLEHAQLLLLVRRPDLAKADADRAVGLAPDSLDALALRAETEEALLDEHGARADADQVIARRATSLKQWQAAVRAERVIARLLVMTNDPNDVKKAQKVAKDAAELDQETTATRLLLYRIQLHPSFADANAEPLEKSLKEAQKKHGTSIETKRVLALIAQVRAGDKGLAKAKDRVQTAEKADPNGAWGHALMAKVLRSSESGAADADPESARALELERDVTRDEGYYYAMGLRTFGQQGGREGAACALRHAAFADPLHAQALVALGEATWQAETQRALEFLMRATDANTLFAYAHATLARRWSRWSAQTAEIMHHAEDEVDLAEKVVGAPDAGSLALRAYVKGRELLFQDRASLASKKDEILKAAGDVAAIYSRSLALDPLRVATGADGFDTFKQLDPMLGFPELRQLARRAQRTRDVQADEVRRRTDACSKLVDQSAQALAGGRTDDALELAKRATRQARWIPGGWIALANARARASDPAGALAACARAASLDEADDPRSFATLARIGPPPFDPAHALAQLATLVRQAIAAGKPLGDVDLAVKRDEDAAPVPETDRRLVLAVLDATAALVAPDAPTAADWRKKAQDAGRELVRRAPEELTSVFANGLAALAAGDSETAVRELGFCALARDDKGELHYLSALARARAAKAAGSDARLHASLEGDALDALETAFGLDSSLSSVAANDRDLGDLAKQLASK